MTQSQSHDETARRRTDDSVMTDSDGDNARARATAGPLDSRLAVVEVGRPGSGSIDATLRLAAAAQGGDR